MITPPPKAAGPQKRALSDLNAPTDLSGDPVISDVLFTALRRASEDDPDALTHGFHVYPARMHRSIAAQVLESFAKPGMHIVDPFCGSGTVLVEARVRALPSTGVDLSPLALRLAALKTNLRSEESLVALAKRGGAVTERCRQRVRAREAARAPISKAEAQRFAPHVLRELAVILEEVRRVDDEADRAALELVLSSLLTKLSLRKSDTDGSGAAKRIGRFIPTELFGKKAIELVGRLRELRDAAKGRGGVVGEVKLLQGDMRTVRLVRQADLILTSPPYAGTYDYATHHDGRMEWLGLDDSALQRHEIGSRRKMAHAPAAAWDAEVKAMLGSLSKMLVPKGRAFIVIGDGEVGGEPVPAIEQLTAIAPSAGLRFVASASAPRRDWRRGGSAPGARYEHLIALERT